MLNLIGSNPRIENVQASQKLLGKLGNLRTRLAETSAELNAAQNLRYQVFCEEMSARKKLIDRIRKKESDQHDRRCDHLIVTDNNASTKPFVVGTQRFFVQKDNRSSSGFYSQQEFDVDALVKRHPNRTFMELGRSCILPEYRSKRTMELMWQGTWAYALNNQVDVMLGCASFAVDCASKISEELGFLSKFTPVDGNWQVKATENKGIPITHFNFPALNKKSAFRKLPPLIKGYLRLGAMFSSQVVPDNDFGTIDILVILPVENINPRYVNYYGQDASKHRA